MKRTEFLLARIAEDAAVAQSVPPYPHDVAVSDVATVRAHLMRWTALRVLAECEAKRQIVEDHASSVEFIGSDPQAGEGAKGRMYGTGAAVAALAAAYADHPDYREEWRP